MCAVARERERGRKKSEIYHLLRRSGFVLTLYIITLVYIQKVQPKITRFSSNQTG